MEGQPQPHAKCVTDIWPVPLAPLLPLCSQLDHHVDCVAVQPRLRRPRSRLLFFFSFLNPSSVLRTSLLRFFCAFKLHNSLKYLVNHLIFGCLLFGPEGHRTEQQRFLLKSFCKCIFPLLDLPSRRSHVP